MFEKTQKSAAELGVAVVEETNQAVNMVKAMVVPTIAGFFGTIAGAANKAKENVQSGDFFSKAKEAATAAPKAEADPIPTAEQNTTILVLRAAGKSDAEIAKILGVSILTIKMAV